jgi:hypothetical protein
MNRYSEKQIYEGKNEKIYTKIELKRTKTNNYKRAQI